MPLAPVVASADPLFVVLLLVYAAVCAVSPFGRCWVCRGFGFKLKQGRFTGRLSRGRDCRWCDATGLRLRFGRRLYNFLASTSRDIR